MSDQPATNNQPTRSKVGERVRRLRVRVPSQPKPKRPPMMTRQPVQEQPTVKRPPMMTRQPVQSGYNPQKPTGERNVRVGSLRWLGMAQEYAKKTGVPAEYYLALIQAESGGNNQAVGDGGSSVGLFQLHSRGVGAGLTVEQRFDPRLQFDKMAPRIQAAYQKGVAQGLSGDKLAIFVGKEAERPAAGREVKYGYTFLQVMDALQSGGMARNVGDYSQTGLLYDAGGYRPNTGLVNRGGGGMMKPMSGPMYATPSASGGQAVHMSGPIAAPSQPTVKPNAGGVIANSATVLDGLLVGSTQGDSDEVTLFKTPLGDVKTSRGGFRKAFITGSAFLGGVMLLVLGILWLIFKNAKGGVAGVALRGARVAADFAKGG